MRIGLIQTGNARDILVALPIAHWFIERGHQVVWPVAETWLAMFAAAMPRVSFLAVPEGLSPMTGYYELPIALLNEAGCDRTFPLYSQLGDSGIADNKLSFSLKFDEYKYAVSQVPFAEKWRLAKGLHRNQAREAALYDRLCGQRNFILVDRQAWPGAVPQGWRAGCEIVDLQNVTDNPFDWALILERATKLILADGFLSSLADQMNTAADLHLIVANPLSATPVYAGRVSWLRAGEQVGG